MTLDSLQMMDENLATSTPLHSYSRKAALAAERVASTGRSLCGYIKQNAFDEPPKSPARQSDSRPFSFFLGHKVQDDEPT